MSLSRAASVPMKRAGTPLEIANGCLTDAYLLGLAVHHRGKLAALDQGIASLAGRSGHGVELIQ